MGVPSAPCGHPAGSALDPGGRGRCADLAPNVVLLYKAKNRGRRTRRIFRWRFRIWPPPTGNGSPGRWRSCSLTITGWQSCDGRGGAEAARRELGKNCRQGFGVIWRTVKMQPVATRLETGFAHGPREMRWQVGASYDERRGRGGVGLKIDGIQSVGRRRTGEARDASAEFSASPRSWAILRVSVRRPWPMGVRG